MKPTSALGLLVYLKPLDLLFRWLAHLVLLSTNETQLGGLQLHSWHQTFEVS